MAGHLSVVRFTSGTIYSSLRSFFIESHHKIGLTRRPGLTPFVTTYRYCSASGAQSSEGIEGKEENDETSKYQEGKYGFRRKVFCHETSMRYLESEEYKEAYGDKPVWYNYRRNFKGHWLPKTRTTCVRKGVISTGSACPICRDQFLTIHYENVKLLQQFLDPSTNKVLPSKKTGVCQKVQKRLKLAVAQAVDIGLIEVYVPTRIYNYSEYKWIQHVKQAELDKQETDAHVQFAQDDDNQQFSKKAENVEEKMTVLAKNSKEIRKIVGKRQVSPEQGR